MHPDGIGGLGPIVGFSFRLTAAIVFVGVLIVLTSVTREYLESGSMGINATADIVVGGICYSLLAPLTFFGITAIPHRAMAAAKASTLDTVAKSFRSLDSEVMTTIAKGGRVDPPVIEQLQYLRDVYERASKLPVWPLSTRNLARFASTFLVPLLLGPTEARSA